MFTIKPGYDLKKCIITLFIISLFILNPNIVLAEKLSNEEATQIMVDAMTIAGYVGIKGEADYQKNPQNILRAALFGGYDAKMEYNFEQSLRKEEGQPLLPADAPLFTINGKTFRPDDVLNREDNPELFEGIPEQYDIFITKQGVELAALRFTGHKVAKHQKLSGEGFLCDTIFSTNGYYLSIEGLGDIGIEPELQSVEETKTGYILHVKLVQVMENEEAPKMIRLELNPGEVADTWTVTLFDDEK